MKEHNEFSLKDFLLIRKASTEKLKFLLNTNVNQSVTIQLKKINETVNINKTEIAFFFLLS